MYNVPCKYKDGREDTVEVLTSAEYIGASLPLADRMILVYDHKKHERVAYFDEPVTFDIETSYTDPDGDRRHRLTWMYQWQMTINGVPIFGRTWDEWIGLLTWMHDRLQLDEKRVLTIYVHNLPYEYAFFHYRVPIKKLFARKIKEPIAVDLGGELTGIRFLCTLALSGYSLAKLAENTPSCPVAKLTGDLDHTVTRTASTPLKLSEMAYCLNDVLILHYYVKSLQKAEKSGHIHTIPLTKTGFTRRQARDEYGSMKKFREWFTVTRLDAAQYRLYHDAFRGGDVHANPLFCGVTMSDCKSYDLTSSYPYRMMCEEDFPRSAPISIDDPTIDDLRGLVRHQRLFIADLIIADVRLKDLERTPYIPGYMCAGTINPTFDNGRVVTAECLSLTATSIDWEIIRHNYDFRIVDVQRLLYHYTRGLLPRRWRHFVATLYSRKTHLKGVEGKEEEYLRLKEDVNSQYGMTVTNPLNDTITFDFEEREWYQEVLQLDPENDEKIQIELDRFYKSRNSFLPYQIGVWVTAAARRDLHRALSALGSDAIYWDTDSVYYVGDHDDLFDRLNAEKLDRMRALDYNEDEIAPVDIRGERHTIGLWDPQYHGRHIRIKTFGSKKYFVDDGELHVTVAGLNKKKAAEYLADIYDDPIEDVDLGLEIPEAWSGRTTAYYHEDGFTIEINGETVHEESYISIVPTTYTLDDTMVHKLYIELCKTDKHTKER